MSYSIKEIFYTLQGEGAHSGRPAVFCRFAGCNLWSGLEKDRAKAICKFCDTDFVGVDGENGGKYKTAERLAYVAKRLWPKKHDRPFIVLTGGEPLLQIDTALISALHDKGFTIAVETNGTLPVPQSIDWICVSPKGLSKVVQISGDELKLVYPQDELSPQQFEDWDFKHFFLQPKDDKNIAENIKATVEYIKSNPKWSLSLQTHKMIGIA